MRKSSIFKALKSNQAIYPNMLVIQLSQLFAIPLCFFLSQGLERQKVGLCSLCLYGALHMVDIVSFRVLEAYKMSVKLL